MSIILRQSIKDLIVRRSFSSSPVLAGKEWRVSKGLPSNPNSEGILTDGPDYTYLDGRPTPLLHKQKLRMLRQRQYAEQIVQMCSELDFAKDRYQKIQQADQQERQRILEDRLKPKGTFLNKK